MKTTIIISLKKFDEFKEKTNTKIKNIENTKKDFIKI